MKKVKYPNLNDYDLSDYIELKGDILYLINGGAMSSADQAAMAQAAASGDEKTMSDIKAKYETKDNSSTATSAGTKTVATSPASTATSTVTTTPTQSAVSSEQGQYGMAKQGAEKKTGASGSGGSHGSNSSSACSGVGSSYGSSNGSSQSCSKGSIGSKSYTPVLTDRERYEKALKYADRRVGIAPTALKTDNSYCVNNYKETVRYADGEPVKGQSLSPNAMKDLIKGKEPFTGRTASLTHAEQTEMARQHAVIKKNTKETKVWIVRNDDGLGNDFNATRYIFKDGKLVYQDVVGANCYKEYYDKDTSKEENYNSTTPDGKYYLTNKSQCLTIQPDGTANSSKYTNVLALMTNDLSISQRDREAVNFGDRYFHANQKSGKEIYSTVNPYGAGCIIGQGGQNHQNEMISVLMSGVYNPTSIQVNIVSLSNMEAFKK